MSTSSSNSSNMTTIKVFLFFIFGIISCIAQEDNDNKPYFRKDYTFIKSLNAYYKVHRNSENWSDALETCQNEGANLAVPTNKEEFDEILKFSGTNVLWIGAHDLFSEGVFLTANGTPLQNIYLKWAPGEPNNYNNNENCITMDSRGYNDLRCTHFRKFVCKKSASILTFNTKCETYDSDYTYLSDTNRCYKFHATPLTWHKALKTCISEESTLVIINSDTEAKILTLMFAQYPKTTLKGNFEKGQIHIGFNELLIPRMHLNNDGTPLSESGYENWSNGQPDYYQNKEHCGSMFRDGTLNDVDCNVKQMFICEKILSENVNLDVRNQ